MNSDYSFAKQRRLQNIKKINIPNSDQYVNDLLNIEYSLTGRSDIFIANIFIKESVQLIINSISLFEFGYFDAAYYSLREAIEISTTIVFFSEMPKREREEKIEAWRNAKDFPMQGQMLSQLYQNGKVVSDMKQKQAPFFNETKELSKRINKYVHKQGLRYFYVSRNSPASMNNQDAFIKDFSYFLEKTIGVVAVMRLAIDPFPILLMDEEIKMRCFDSITEAYSEDFVKKYIPEETIEGYKNTKIYIDHYSELIKKEKKNIVVFNIMKYKVIETAKKNAILSQISLLNDVDKIAANIALSSNKVVKIYVYDGVIEYFTDRKINRNRYSTSTLDFIHFRENSDKFNQKYDEAFISVFSFKVEDKNEFFYIEHNEKLNMYDIDLLRTLKIN